MKAEAKLESQEEVEEEQEVGLLMVEAPLEMGPWQNLEAKVRVEEE